MTVTVHHGDCREVLRGLLPSSVQCCVTSPPYFGLRNYNVDSQIGLEQTPDKYVTQLVEVFRGVRRILRDDGSVWLNLGDSYATGPGNKPHTGLAKAAEASDGNVRLRSSHRAQFSLPPRSLGGAKPKDLLMIPARVALALQADGWYLRSAIVWHKPNPMPESCKDRPTSAYEMVFLLTKQSTYFYNANAIAESASENSHGGKPIEGGRKQKTLGQQVGGRMGVPASESGGNRNARNVWTITPKPFRCAHFATMPPDLVERCIKAGSRPGDTILDPFGGAGTTGLVANRLGRKAVLIELNRDYCDMAIRRINDASPLFANVA